MTRPDGVAVILQVGSEGGDLTLLGRRAADGAWEFTRETVDQTEHLFGESGSGVAPGPVRAGRGWTRDWEAALTMLDRYRWARLHPLEVHPEFSEQVRMAVEERLGHKNHGGRDRAGAGEVGAGLRGAPAMSDKQNHDNERSSVLTRLLTELSWVGATIRTIGPVVEAMKTY